MGARIHEHLKNVEADTPEVVTGLHKRVRKQMQGRRELHAEIGGWQDKNKELQRQIACVAAAELAQDRPKGTHEKIHNGIANNPLRRCAAPSRATTPGGAAAEDSMMPEQFHSGEQGIVPGQIMASAALAGSTDVNTVPMPVLPVDGPPDELSDE